MKKNFFLRIAILLLFVYLVLFSFPSLSAIPGDFNNDGRVDFEDLMIFALAYGSTPMDGNWNEGCDLRPDNKIDFEDLMIFAMNYEKEEVTTNHAPEVNSIPVTSVMVNGIYTYKVEATDADGDALTYSLAVSPAGMVIDADTGEITWTPDAIQIGDHDVTVEVTDGDDVATQSFVVTVYDILTSIVVLPATMDLSAGQSKAITSIVASYANSPDKSIALAACSYQSSNSAVATAAAGVITGVSGGIATITVSYTEGANTQTDTIDITVNPPEPVNRRALLIGVGDYMYGDNDLPGPPYDVDMMRDTLSHFGNGFALINELKDWDATKSAILNGIDSTFSEANSNDVSYFYFTGHGGPDQYGNSYLIPTDNDGTTNTAISVSELESALSAIPGTKVVFLDACHSGGFIGRETRENEISSNPEDFNRNVINVFASQDLSRDLTGSQYQVLTSCLASQTCIGLTLEDDSFGLFSRVLCEGCGYDYYSHPYDGDANKDGKITLNEAYIYTDEQVYIIIDILNAPPYEWGVDQNTQVYPENSNFVIIEEFEG